MNRKQTFYLMLIITMLITLVWALLLTLVLPMPWSFIIIGGSCYIIGIVANYVIDKVLVTYFNEED